MTGSLSCGFEHFELKRPAEAGMWTIYDLASTAAESRSGADLDDGFGVNASLCGSVGVDDGVGPPVNNYWNMRGRVGSEPSFSPPSLVHCRHNEERLLQL